MTDKTMLSKADLLERMQTGWNDLNTTLGALSEQQWTGPTDAVGWTVKDHLAHIVVWEDSVGALLDGMTRPEFTGVEGGTWETGNFDIDPVNAVLRQRYHDMPLDALLRLHRDVHERLIRRIESMSDEDLHQPYSHYQPDATWTGPVIDWIVGNTYGHYDEHRPWMDAILSGAG